MKPYHRICKQSVRAFLQSAYTDENLAALLAHAKDGKLAFTSCCCLIGIPTADHALQGHNLRFEYEPHYSQEARKLPGAVAAEESILTLSRRIHGYDGCVTITELNSNFRRVLIPMVKAEMRRRDRLAMVKEWKEELALVTT